MLQLKRRDFLTGMSALGAGVLASGNTWALNRLEPIKDSLQEEYPYRNWDVRCHDTDIKIGEHDFFGFEHNHNIVDDRFVLAVSRTF